LGALRLWPGRTLEDRPRCNNTRCFETFPFPAADTGLTPELTDRIRSLAEQLDAHRKARPAAHDTITLTLTGLYNLLAKLRSGELLTPHGQPACHRRAPPLASRPASADARRGRAAGRRAGATGRGRTG